MQITEREKEVLQLVASGRTNKSIGDKLNIKERTVEQYLHILMCKIPSENRAQLVYEAQKKGVIV